MELSFINNLQRHFNPSGGVDGIGDDGVFVSPYIYVSDTVVEGVHFHPTTPRKHVLHYLFTSNISDMAAMGAKAEYGILNISAPVAFLSSETASTIKELCHANGIRLIGGDTCGGSSVVLSLTLFGRAEHNILTRSGATAGDIIFISRPIGLTNIALANETQLSRRSHETNNSVELGNPLEGELDLYYHYNRPPETKLGLHLAATGVVTSCMDISDGLGVDLTRLGKSSGVRCVVHEDALPLEHIETMVDRVQKLGGMIGVDGTDVGRVSPLEHALSSGQEFALLFTVAPQEAYGLQEHLRTALGREIIPVGWCEEYVEGEHHGVVCLQDSTTESIANRGWIHGN